MLQKDTPLTQDPLRYPERSFPLTTQKQDLPLYIPLYPYTPNLLPDTTRIFSKYDLLKRYGDCKKDSGKDTGTKGKDTETVKKGFR